MRLLVVSIRDDLAGQCGGLYTVPNVAVAVRMFVDSIRQARPDEMLRLHTDNFSLVEVGCFDNESGQLHHHQQMYEGDSRPFRVLKSGADVVRELVQESLGSAGGELPGQLSLEDEADAQR